jgi:multidrug resistance efflux pump
VATARAEVEAAQRIIATLEKQGDELRAELAQARRPFWRRWFDQK